MRQMENETVNKPKKYKKFLQHTGSEGVKFPGRSSGRKFTWIKNVKDRMHGA